jgi:hypothetical protein
MVLDDFRRAESWGARAPYYEGHDSFYSYGLPSPLKSSPASLSLDEHGLQDAGFDLEYKRGVATLAAEPSWALLGPAESLSISSRNLSAAAAWSPDEFHVFVRSAKDILQHKMLRAGTWSEWESPAAVAGLKDEIGLAMSFNATAVSWRLCGTDVSTGCSESQRRLDVFYPDSSGSLRQLGYDGSWATADLGGVAASDPVAVSWGDDRLDIFVLGTDSKLQHINYVPDAWSAWESAPFSDHTWLSGERPTATSPGIGKLDVFGRGSDKGLQRFYWDGSGNWKWNDCAFSVNDLIAQAGLVSGLTSQPIAVSMTAGRSDVFIRGADLSLWTAVAHDDSCGEWKSLGKPGGMNMMGAPTAISRAPGRIAAYARAADSSLWAREWTGLIWTEWAMVATEVAGDMTAALSGRGTELLASKAEGLSSLHWHSVGALWKPSSGSPAP